MATAKAKKKSDKITTKAEAESAVEKLHELQTELAALRKEHGIVKLENEIDRHKSAIVAFAVKNKMKTIPADGVYANIVEQTFDKRVIATDEELAEVMETISPEDDRERTSLYRIIFGKFNQKMALSVWNACTRPVVHMPGLDDAVASGLLTVDEIQPAYHERKKAPYVRLYGEK